MCLTLAVVLASGLIYTSFAASDPALTPSQILAPAAAPVAMAAYAPAPVAVRAPAPTI